MDALLEIGLSNAVAAGVLALLAVLVGLMGRRPALVHALWLLVLLKLITPPLVRLPTPWFQTSTQETPAPPDREKGPWELEEVEIVQPALAGDWWPEAVELAEGGEPIPEKNVAIPSEEKLPGPEIRRLEPLANSGAFDWKTPVMGVWLTGSLAWFVVAGRRIWQFQRSLGHTTLASEEVQERARQLAVRLRLPRCPEVWVWPARVSPLLWWIGGRARLVLPAKLLGELTPAALDTLLLHELAHFRRRDHWVRILEFLVLGLYWWHPAVWYARRELRESEEQCCDAWVVTALPGSARTYALALVETLDFLAGAQQTPAMASGVGPVSDLKRRVTMILRGSTPRGLSWPTGLGVFVLAIFLLPILPVWGQAPGKEEPRKDVLKFKEAKKGGIEFEFFLKGGEDQGEAELNRLAAEIQAKQAELDAARARLDQARAARKGIGPRAEFHKDNKGKPQTREGGGVTIRIEINGLEGKPEELKELLQKLEKELTGKDRKVIIMAHPESMGMRYVHPGVGKGILPGNMPVPGPNARFEIKPVPGVPPPPPPPGGKGDGRIEGLEKKLDNVLRELEELRRDMKGRRP